MILHAAGYSPGLCSANPNNSVSVQLRDTTMATRDGISGGDAATPEAAPAARMLGKLQEFDSRVDNMSSYLERLEIYFDANAVEASRKVSVFLTVIGAKAYDTLRSLLAPTLPRDKTFPELLAVLKQHFDPKPLVIAERYKRSQKSTETVAEFLADLRKLSIRCDFGTFLDQALRDRFVCGVRSDAIQKKLLSEDDLTIARALEIAQSIKAADKNSLESLNFAGAKKSKPCYRCGCRHDAKLCKFRNAQVQ